MTSIERTLLEHYKLPSLEPVEWPAAKDEDADDFQEDALAVDRRKSRAKRRYTTLQLTSKTRHNTSRPQDANGGAKLIQDDEPDPLGYTDSVIRFLRNRGLPVKEDVELRNKYLLSSTAFSPTLYLSSIHNNASTEDLLKGLEFLSDSIEKKSASLKVLVESNFERFVRAKSTIDNVYTEMRNRGLDLDPHAALHAKLAHSRHSSRTSFHGRNLSGGLGASPNAVKSPESWKRKNALLKETEYGVQGIRAPLLEANARADEIWGPALGGRDREESLKLVLESIDRHKSIFDLGSIIEDCIKRRDHEMLAEEYKRANKFVREARELANRSKMSGGAVSESDLHQILITARVWNDIEKRVLDLKRELWKRLVEAHFRVDPSQAADNKGDEYMEIIALLLELGTEDNPVLIWLSGRREFLRTKVAFFFERVRVELEIARRRLVKASPPTGAALASHLRSISIGPISLVLSKKDDTTRLDTQAAIKFWEQVLVSLTNLLGTSEGILAEFMEFVQICRGFADGSKLKDLPHTLGADRRRQAQVTPEEGQIIKANILELVGLIRDQVQGLFIEPPIDDISAIYTPTTITPIAATPLTPGSTTTLTPHHFARFQVRPEDVPPPSPKTGEWWEKNAFWPPRGNSLSAATYLSKIMALIATAAGAIASLDVVKTENNVVTSLRNLVGDVRERSITAICNAWLHDCAHCQELEDWTRSKEKKDATNLPMCFTAWESSMLSYLQKIVYVSDAADRAGTAQVVLPPPQRHVETVQKAFKTGLFKALQGMMEHTAKPAATASSPMNGDGLAVPLMADPASAHQGRADIIDASTSDVRKLLTMANFQALRSESIPVLIGQFETNFSLTISDDAKIARDALSQMYSRVFNSFVKATNEKLRTIITEGVEHSQRHSSTQKKEHPTDARPFVYDVLLSLVLLHTTVMSITPSLTPQIMSFFLEQVSGHLLAALKLRPTRYDLPSLMQATLDVEFISQTLSNYTTEKAGEIQSEIYQALDERTDNEARAQLQMELKEMKRVLKGLREGTKGGFGCFRRTKKTSTERAGDGLRPSRDRDRDRDAVAKGPAPAPAAAVNRGNDFS